MIAADAKGMSMPFPHAASSCDRVHVVAMAVDAMDTMRQAAMRNRRVPRGAAYRNKTDRSRLSRSSSPAQSKAPRYSPNSRCVNTGLPARRWVAIAPPR